MANEFRKVIDTNNLVHPVCDDTRVDWSSYAKTGVQNRLKNVLTTQTSGSTTITVDSDGVITITGTFGSAIYKTLGYLYPEEVANGESLKKFVEDYGTGIKLSVYGLKRDDTYDYNIPNPFTVDWTTYKRYDIYLTIDAAFTSGTVVHPMLYDSAIPNPTFAPYAMTNKDLTDAVQGIINAATNAADFAAFKTAIGNL